MLPELVRVDEAVEGLAIDPAGSAAAEMTWYFGSPVPEFRTEYGRDGIHQPVHPQNPTRKRGFVLQVLAGGAIPLEHRPASA
jgi:hypothetical protein